MEFKRTTNSSFIVNVYREGKPLESYEFIMQEDGSFFTKKQIERVLFVAASDGLRKNINEGIL